ncbi:RagB/SusD domain protein [Pseudopedobacter saltans DSM 12145]|uniref:RagB/SusD domain protein n=1 Tax=Pseudopedobacter saltans (strain ATCC 51119 / DSM 12145 / JCM 21818 / CCUG 39354 / LMG 10337 / NBRC 100064 / NCIMB 13643) TaxID=762903 RepID=F0SBI0_PSESL|nr:RagB/SusD family nutrient uptake outer membrane protein [Pseudopedobacter saltans]ADY51626.1 RagB/SusD domain protein [Pseudopedobacter saltans DSM 12145]
MNTKNIYIKSVVGLCLGSVLCVSSCKDYLTEKPSSQFSADFVYNTPEGLEAGVVGLYNLQRAFFDNGDNNGSNSLIIDAKDDLTVPRGGEISNYGLMKQGTTADNSSVHSYWWSSYYKIVDRSNAIIAAGEKLANIDEAKRKVILAEAKFFRANAVFTLFKTFNNIYITTEPTSFETAFKTINSKTPEAEIYKLVNEDLSYAISNLAWTSYQLGRVNQATARHLKAEVALWQKNWPEAKLQSEEIIAQTNNYALQSSTGQVFAGDLNHKESLWTLQYKESIDGNPNKLNFNLMPNYAELIPGSKYSIEQGGRGFGWLTVNNYLRDLLLADPNDTRIKGTYYIKDYFYNDPATLPAGKVLGSKIVHDQWQEFAPNGNDRHLFFVRLTVGCKKYFPTTGIPTADAQTMNRMMFRLAETFLFAAEANLNLGNIGTVNDAATSKTALGQINAVRKRAGAAPLSSLTLQDILNEQARELAFEGKRWYMLKRTGKLYSFVKEHAGYGRPGDESSDTNQSTGHANTPADPYPYRNDARRIIKPYMVNWVIPKAQLNLLGPNYPQNDDY